jgi:hypothetical protein
MNKRGVAALIAVVLVITALVFWLLRLSDHTVEFRDALLAGDHDRVEALLKKHSSLANATGMDLNKFKWGKPVVVDGWTPLHLAAYVGDAEMIKQLAHYHANVNVKDKSGLTPLLWTVFGGKRDAAAALLECGADINARGKDGRSTIDLAKLSLDNQLIELLREHGAKE